LTFGAHCIITGRKMFFKLTIEPSVRPKPRSIWDDNAEMVLNEREWNVVD
jgi:hypothetical protein